MNLVERQKQFLDAAQLRFGTNKKLTRVSKLFGVSNSAKIVEGGLQIGVANLVGANEATEAVIFAGVLKFPPEDEVYFAILVRKDRANLVTRLAKMILQGAAAKGVIGDQDAKGDAEEEAQEEAQEEAAESVRPFKYSDRNNNVAIYLAKNGRLLLRNSGFWDSLDFDLTPFGPAVELDEIVVSLYPPTASARRSLLAREFIGWLGTLAGPEKIHELPVWDDAGIVSAAMRRMPSTIALPDIEAGVLALGGHYPHGEVRRFHAALNFLSHKHFVILSGISGTGKTQLALKYARAVHGVTTNTEADPLIFECPVRPEWTDPTGLTGYYDVLTNRYVVPTFLEAVLVATAHRDSPVFVVLDEMNLARVEYYLSDVLSCIETQGALQLHSSNVPLEGTTGTSIRAALPFPQNLFIIGTINVDETTNPVSDKVLDRASVIDMSLVDLPGFLVSLEARNPNLTAARAVSEPKLAEVHQLMQKHGLGFGYRLIEEFVRYHAFDAAHLNSSSNDVTDELLVQKVLVKLRGAERQRSLLTSLEKVCQELPRTRVYLQKLLGDLNDYGSFQAMR
jgi:5-methylcytosine-specific restriction protein B